MTDFAHELRYRSGSCVVTDRATGRTTVNWGGVSSFVSYTILYSPYSGNFTNIHFQLWPGVDGFYDATDSVDTINVRRARRPPAGRLPPAHRLGGVLHRRGSRPGVNLGVIAAPSREPFAPPGTTNRAWMGAASPGM
ncbi:hypothetical protein [Polymorphospora sp. NPDC050346]|uniref:hypothetical protein n=1 Tax=Polymorphospora sp. NPDC050346 TaxID=3155780 RepID=UPI00340B9761